MAGRRDESDDDGGDGSARSRDRDDKKRHDAAGDDKDTDTDNDGDGKDDEEDRDDDKDDSKPSFFKSTWFKIGAAIVLIVAIVVALVWWLNARKYEDTDDAFIDTHIVHIAPQIAGQIVAIHVTDNQYVRKGQPLVDIDSADATAKLNQIQAQEAQAETQYYQALASERGAEAQTQNAERDLGRYRLLQSTAPAAVAQQQIDQAVATDKNAIAQRDSARAQISGAMAQIKAYKAQISAAQLTLSYTHVAAPEDGTIAQRTVALGNYVTPGQEMMAVVPLHIWVTANFKETQLARMRVGQHVTVEVDACADADIRGHVDSIQRGAGQAFGILPPENATGNYVKVVQRVPVKILLDRVPKDCVLGPGMSVEPSVKVR